MASSLAPATLKSYRSALSSLSSFCEDNSIDLTFPVSTDLLCLWVTHLARHLSHSSIRAYLHGVGTLHTLYGHTNPISDASLVWRAYLGAKRLQGGEAREATRLPITVELLLDLERWQHMDSTDGLLVRAAMWLGTCGLLRSGEFTVRNKSSSVLLRKHLTFYQEQGGKLPLGTEHAAYMLITLPRSKTDQFGAGPAILVSHPKAIQVMCSYLRSASGLSSDEPLLRTEKGEPLTHVFLMERVRALLLTAGVEEIDRYKGHSFRRGGATSLHLAGQPDSVIKAMGRWRSFTFATYVDTPRSVLFNAGRSMTKAPSHGKSVTFTARQFESWTRPVWEKDEALSCASPGLQLRRDKGE